MSFSTAQSDRKLMFGVKRHEYIVQYPPQRTNKDPSESIKKATPHRFREDNSPTSHWVTWPHLCWRGSTSDRPSANKWQHRFPPDGQSVLAFGVPYARLFVRLSSRETDREGSVCHWPSMQNNLQWHSNQQTWLVSMFFLWHSGTGGAGLNKTFRADSYRYLKDVCWHSLTAPALSKSQPLLVRAWIYTFVDIYGTT